MTTSTFDPYVARYYGQLVIVSSQWHVAGGVACRVRRHPDAVDWPWTVTEFTTAQHQLAPIEPSGS
ncbi:hypothetical protein [Nannocystis pusilla]|uniref:hypothetical protein n=1 Tax=Nannocystis pusilla TaxID=889268 RepID=UPI003B8243DA